MSDQILEQLSTAMADAVETAEKSVVQVKARGRMPASGILYAPDLVLTADHVVEREEDIPIALFDSTQLTAKLAGRDPSTDLALLRLSQPADHPAQRSPDPARIGQIVLALGRPSIAGVEASLGIVSASGGPVHTGNGRMLERYIRTDTIPYPGFSGGPLVDASGRALGMNTSGIGRGVSVTIPAEIAWRIAESLAQHGKVRRAYLGVRSQPVELPESARQALDRGQEEGLLLVSVEYNGPAGHAGLMIGDILVGIGDMAVSDHDTLYAQLKNDLVGRTETVQILRAGQLHSIKVKFKEK